MEIYDLTGNYQDVKNLGITIEEIMMDGLKKMNYPINNFMYLRFKNRKWKINLNTLLQDVPVYLVNKSLIGKQVTVPDTAEEITVPEDKDIEVDEDEFSTEKLNEWFKEKESELNGENKSKNYYDNNKDSKNVKIVELLGVYYPAYGSISQPSIFIWIDKIQNCAQDDINDKESNAYGLLLNVILHEWGHALMDVALYGDTPSSYFSYNEYMYRLYEEGLANAFSLFMGYDRLSDMQKVFIKGFVNSQPLNYKNGWDIFSINPRVNFIQAWMTIKARFDICIMDLLKYATNLNYKHDKFIYGLLDISYIACSM